MRARRVLVEAAILKPNLGGLRTYIRELVGALAERDDVDLHVVTSCPADVPMVPPGRLIECPPATRGFVPRAAWREAVLDRLVRRTAADVVLAPYPEMTLRRLSAPAVMVVHDVRGLVAPRYETGPRKLRFRLALGPACRTADRVVCVSEFTAACLDASVAIDGRRVTVIGEAPARRPDTEEAAPATPVPRPYVLYVGSLLPHKNVDTLVKAFAQDGDGPDLRLAGPASDEERRHLDALVADLGCQDRVYHLGWLGDGELRHWYGRATAVAVPSLYEGFGLPVLEAMDAGVPVIASDIPAFREVAGDHATLVGRPRDPFAWQAALRSISADDAVIAAARNWAQRTTWTEVAAAFVKLFDELPSRGGRA